MSRADILIVEDKALTAMEIEQKLQSLGYGIKGRVDNGKDAIHQAFELEPDLILMDLRLKGEMTGIDAAREINQHRDIPIVFMTAHTEVETTELARETGPAGYIAKPVDEEELYAVLEIALFRNREIQDEPAGTAQ